MNIPAGPTPSHPLHYAQGRGRRRRTPDEGVACSVRWSPAGGGGKAEARPLPRVCAAVRGGSASVEPRRDAGRQGRAESGFVCVRPCRVRVKATHGEEKARPWGLMFTGGRGREDRARRRGRRSSVCARERVRSCPW
jgi:hypothetical protein